jgi:hypothetical protein
VTRLALAALLLLVLATQAGAVTLSDMIDALFFRSGPASEHGHPPTPGLVMGTWPTPVVTVVFGAGVPRPLRVAVLDAAAQVPEATHGRLSVSSWVSGDLVPWPRRGEISFAVVDDPRAYGFRAGGGIRWDGTPSSQGELVAARVVFPEGQTPQAAQHDVVGHGVLALAHVNAWAIGGPQMSLMAYGLGVHSGLLPYGLSALDLAAIRAVYGSGLTAGATRDDFLAAGLIAAPVGGLLPVRSRGGDARGGRWGWR